jgi:hypothetical protein
VGADRVSRRSFTVWVCACVRARRWRGRGLGGLDWGGTARPPTMDARWKTSPKAGKTLSNSLMPYNNADATRIALTQDAKRRTCSAHHTPERMRPACAVGRSPARPTVRAEPNLEQLVEPLARVLVHEVQGHTAVRQRIRLDLRAYHESTASQCPGCGAERCARYASLDHWPTRAAGRDNRYPRGRAVDGPGGRASGMARQLGCGGESNRRLRVRDRLPSQRPKPSRHGKLLQGVLLCVCVYAYAAVLHAIVGQHNLLVHRRRRCHPERGDPCVWMPPGELRSVLCSWRELRGLCPKHASRSIRVGARQDRTARAKRGTNSTVYIIIVAQGHGAPSTLVGRVVAHASTKSDARDPVDGRIPSCQ